MKQVTAPQKHSKSLGLSQWIYLNLMPDDKLSSKDIMKWYKKDGWWKHFIKYEKILLGWSVEKIIDRLNNRRPCLDA